MHQEFKENRDHICILDQIHVRLVLDSLSDTSFIKISKHFFGNAYRGHVYSKSSPYVGRFNTIIQRIMESGIQDL